MQPRPHPIVLGLAAALLALGASSCISYFGTPGVALSSQPSGAKVVINGQDSGFVTPCNVALDNGEHHRIEFFLDGYEPAVRRTRPVTTTTVIFWREGGHWPRHFPFPTELPFREFWWPLNKDKSLYPDRIYVRLRLAREE